MFSFHSDCHRYFELQAGVTRQHILPYVRSYLSRTSRPRVLDIGSDIGAVLKVFSEAGCDCTGVEMEPVRIALSTGFLENEIASGQVRLIKNNIFNIGLEDFDGRFDLIILKDVIEHIHQPDLLLSRLHSLLQPGGVIFIAFPPWQMPFGGHQQICSSRILSRLPYFHLLPRAIYQKLLQWTGQPVDALLEVRDTRLSIEQFEFLTKQQRFCIDRKTAYLINPVYELKFGWKAKKQFSFIAAVPWIRNFFTTGMYYVLVSTLKGRPDRSIENVYNSESSKKQVFENFAVKTQTDADSGTHNPFPERH